jgi:hypothetical protein
MTDERPHLLPLCAVCGRHAGPHSCRGCGRVFELSTTEADWYKARGLHIPSHCPDCRQAARVARRARESSRA